jgi:hypothetical protein
MCEDNNSICNTQSKNSVSPAPKTSKSIKESDTFLLPKTPPQATDIQGVIKGPL